MANMRSDSINAIRTDESFANVVTVWMLQVTSQGSDVPLSGNVSAELLVLVTLR